MDTCSDISEGDAGEPGGLLGRVGRELALLAAVVQDLQLTLSPALVGDAGLRPHMMVSVQRLDLIEQTLVNLAHLMACLQSKGQSIDAGHARDALSVLSLSDLTLRLSLEHHYGRAPCGAAQDAAHDAADDLELF